MKNKKKSVLLIAIFLLGGMFGIKASELITSGQVIYKDNQTVDVALNNLYEELQEGKELLADAISNQGVETTSNNTLSEMAYNVNNISDNTGALKMIVKDSVTADDLKNAVMVGVLININGTTSDTFIIAPISGISVGSGDINGAYFGIGVIWDKENGTLAINPANSLTIKKYFLFTN